MERVTNATVDAVARRYAWAAKRAGALGNGQSVAWSPGSKTYGQTAQVWCPEDLDRDLPGFRFGHTGCLTRGELVDAFFRAAVVLEDLVNDGLVDPVPVSS